ncbi:MAG: chemotaxis protein CheB [Gammaproteobacteria bacterium]|nr:chemotaxis protein CheB [Gammaproteobacteria bacterium]
MQKPYIIVIGASSGGIEPLKSILSKLPGDINASIFIVLHVGPQKKSLLANILSKDSELPITTAENNMIIKKNHVYIAPPNKHMILKKDKIELTNGPRINFVRPSIDVLFTSAARCYKSRVIGILLSGLLDDGTAGFMDIKTAGGITIAQDPRDAMQAEMPKNAIQNSKVDFIKPANDISDLLKTQTTKQLKMPPKIKAKDKLESIIEESSHEITQTQEDELNQIGKASVFTCPECNGTLWEIDDKHKLRYRCRIGHAYNINSLMSTQDTFLENTLWAGVRALEESASLSNRIFKQLKLHKNMHAANFYNQKEKEANKHAIELRKMILLSNFMVNKNSKD